MYAPRIVWIVFILTLLIMLAPLLVGLFGVAQFIFTGSSYLTSVSGWRVAASVLWTLFWFWVAFLITRIYKNL